MSDQHNVGHNRTCSRYPRGSGKSFLNQPTTNLLALRRIHTTFNLTVLPTLATRITEHSSTIIDLMVTDHPLFIKKSKAVNTNSISDHEAVNLIADVRIPEAPPRRMKVWNLGRIDLLRLQADFQTKDIYQEGDIDIKTQLLTSELYSLLSMLRDLAYSLYVRNPNHVRGDAQWRDYISKKSRAGTLIGAAKKRYADSQFGMDLPTKQLWCNLRREGIHNNAKKNAAMEEFDADRINQFFAEGHHMLHHRAVPSQANAESDRPPANVADGQFQFRCTNVNEVTRKICEIGTNAKGTNEITISFIKLLCPFILPLPTHLFNAIIDAQTFPSVWKKAIVTPIPKSSNPTSPKDFRPISVLPAVSKVLEKILLSQITDHLDVSTPALLAKHRSGYKKNHSTTTALVKVAHDILNNFDDNRCTVMVLVDFSLAFNCVRHGLLETKLRREFGFSNSACNLISSFLAQRSQAVDLGGTPSNPRNLTDGTPPGSCLSTLLFSLYINSLPGVLKCEYHLYADDLQI
ncbi:uncharacterized protein LOC135700263 [Ochlerotatus camptorhynchus]|uniref:uncharacterized protein LOC135700263 n=1 Tax=Ochlerotatus camptorhynchus TaxID=644619 RepID=UPI0031DB7146